MTADATTTSAAGETVSFAQPTVTYDLAARAVALTIEEGRKAGVRTCATVVDPALQMVAYGRTDGMTPHSVETSRRKAQTAASTRRPSALIVPELAQKLEQLSAVNRKVIRGLKYARKQQDVKDTGAHAVVH